MFAPTSVAVLGASPRENSVGATVWRNLNEGGFQGALYPVNLKHAEISGSRIYRTVHDLPAVPDLGIVCTPPASVPRLIEELAQRGTRAVVVMTSGMDALQRRAMLAAARPKLLRLLGPNCIGLLAPHMGLNASFAHINALPGELAFVSQSGALVTAMLDWARGNGIGFSNIVSLGEHADVDFGDMLDYLGSDAKTRAILLYIESITAPRKFMSAARAAARNKPVIVVKSGRSLKGQQAAASHTGALAGSDAVYDAAIARAGMLRVDTLQELFLAAQTLSHLRNPLGDAITIFTNGGGAGVLAADAAARASVELAPLSADTLSRLDAILPANWSRCNPVDIIGDAPVERYTQTLEVLLNDKTAGTLLMIHAPTAIVPSSDIAAAMAPLLSHKAGSAKRLIGCWLGDSAVVQARRTFQDAGVTCFATPEDSVRAFSLLTHYRRNQAELTETPSAANNSSAVHVAAIRQQVELVLAERREILTEPEAKTLLAHCGIPVVPTKCVGQDPEAAAGAAVLIGFPVTLKILSKDISHKSDVGGVALDLKDATAVRQAAQEMLTRVRRERPTAVLQGFTVQAMVARKHAQELIIGSTVDDIFGPVILFGQGGTAVEVVADRAIALPPLNTSLARNLVSRTRVSRLLQGWRDAPAVDQLALQGVLVAVSQLLEQIPQIAELDINPLLVNFEGVVALDARVRLSATAPGGTAHFAILPYPTEWEETVLWRDKSVVLRPIRPDDEAMHEAFLRQLDPQDVRMRVLYSKRTLARSELARLVQIDYSREMAFIAVSTGPDGLPQTLGVARAVGDPDNLAAEFGLIVRSDLKGCGLGELLLKKLITYFRSRGTKQLVASVLRDNYAMRHLAKKMGFSELKEGIREGDTEALSLNLQ